MEDKLTFKSMKADNSTIQIDINIPGFSEKKK